MPAVTNGAELVRLLKATQTGADKLALGRAVLEEVRRESGRVATSAEVIAGIERGLALKTITPKEWDDGLRGPPHATLDKARALAATGTWTGPADEDEPRAIEDELLDLDAPKAAVPAKKAEPKTEPTKDETRPGVYPAGKAGDDKPGVKK